MATYRCAKCGSPHVTKQESDVKFSYKKALVGTAVFGAVGAVAGINGKRKYTYVCADCGYHSALPMDDSTRISIDVLIDTPSLFEKMNPDLLKRYSYLRTEMRAAAPASEEYVAAAQQYANPLNITELDVRRAAKLWYDTMCERNRPEIEFTNDHKPRWCMSSYQGPKPIEMYVEAFAATHTIVYGLPAYPYLAMDQDDTESGLNKWYLITAVLQYILDRHGDMTLQEFYDTVRYNPVYSKTFACLKKSGRPFEGESYIPECVTWANNHKMSSSPRNLMYWGMLHDTTLLKRKFFLVNGSIYTYGPTAEHQFAAEYPEVAEKLENIQKEIKDIELKINRINEHKPNTSAKDFELNRLLLEVNQAEDQITALRKKFFGRAKARQEADVLEGKKSQLKKQIAKIKEEIQQIKVTDRMEKDEQLEALHAQEEKLVEEENFINEQKKEILASYSPLICIHGSDCIEPPLPDSYTASKKH